MTDRTYIKVARKAEYDGGYATLTEVAGGVTSGEGGQGPQGEKGDTGPQGPEGPEGPQGIQGEAGADGATGADGADGADGANGADGADGADGAVRKYNINSVTLGLASRDGDLFLSSAGATTLNAISVGIRDNNGNETPPVNAGDIVDIEKDGAINRYIVASGSIGALELTYQYGSSTFAVGNLVNLYVYPQNSSSIYTVDEEGDPHYGNHPLQDVGHPVADTDAATKGYVDSLDNTNGLPVYRYAEKQMETLQNGEFVCFDSSNNYTKLLGAIRAILWKGVDANGTRPVRDANAANWEGNLNSAFSFLTNNGSQLIMRVSMSQVINGHPGILYNAFYDVYAITWSGGDSTTNTSTLTTMADSQTVAFQCPELFF